MPVEHVRYKTEPKDLMAPSPEEYAYAERFLKELEASMVEKLSPDECLKVSRMKSKRPESKINLKICEKLGLPDGFVLKHSFIKVGGKVFALAVHDELGFGGWGKVKHCWDEWGNLLAYKAERVSFVFGSLEKARQYCAQSDCAIQISGQRIASGFLFSNTDDLFYDKPESLRNDGLIVKKITIMIKMNGPDLYDYLFENRLRIKKSDCLIIFHNIMKAVSDLHEKNVLHLDLKAENIKIDESLAVSIIDFGFSVVSKPEDPDDKVVSLYNMRGTYKAPEIMEQRYCKKTDIYAIAVLMFGGKIYTMNRPSNSVEIELESGWFVADKIFNAPLMEVVRLMGSFDFSERPTAKEVVQAIIDELKLYSSEKNVQMFFSDLEKIKLISEYSDLVKGRKKASLYMVPPVYPYPSGFQVGIEPQATGLVVGSDYEDCEVGEAGEDNTPDNLREMGIYPVSLISPFYPVPLVFFNQFSARNLFPVLLRKNHEHLDHDSVIFSSSFSTD